MDDIGQRCEATTKAGTRCKHRALPGSRWCWWHSPDPEIAERRKEARAKGGRARHGRTVRGEGMHEPLEIANLGDLAAALVEEINAVRSLELSIARARALAYIAGVLAGIWEASELERRIEALEQRIGG